MVLPPPPPPLEKFLRYPCTHSVPHSLTERLDDVEELVDVGVAREERIARQHLGRQTADRPDVHRPDDKQQQRTGCRQTDVTTKFLGRQTANRPDTCMNRPDDTQRIHRDVLVNFTSWWKEA